MSAIGRRTTNRLSAVFVKKCKPTDVIADHRDGNGLILRVHVNGRKQWIWRGTIRGEGRERMFGLGSADIVSLAEARESALQYKKLARLGQDPRGIRNVGTTFAEAARRKYLELAPTFKSAKASAQWIGRVERICGPAFGSRPIADVTTAEVRSVFVPIWQKTPEAASRARQTVERIFDWSIASGLRTDNPATLERLGLPTRVAIEKHHPSLPYEELPEFIIRLRRSRATLVVRLCLEFLILTATRSIEARGARWDEIDLDTRTWTIPGGRDGRMKGKNPPDHIVPLSDAAASVLMQCQNLPSRKDALVFPKPSGAMLSENAFSPLLKSMELKRQATPHGMRATFKTWATNEGANERDIAEFCLAHKVNNKIERSYMRGIDFKHQVELMQRWAIYATEREKRTR